MGFIRQKAPACRKLYNGSKHARVLAKFVLFSCIHGVTISARLIKLDPACSLRLTVGLLVVHPRMHHRLSPAERGNRHDPGVAGEDLLIVVAFRTVEGKLEKTMLA